MVKYPSIEVAEQLSPQDFFLKYVGKKPVILKNFVSQWRAVHFWNKDYFIKQAGNEQIEVNLFDPYGIEKQAKTIPLVQYVENILQPRGAPTDHNDGSYFYAMPLTTLLSELTEDLLPFPTSYLESWYRSNWRNNLFFFYTHPGTLIPFHFDGLGTHNLYFHLKGTKKFIITLADDLQFSYMSGHHSSVNPEKPDHKSFPDFEKARTYEAILSPGDTLYLPPYTLHQVLSLDQCISVKIDWHTKRSAILSMVTLYKGIKLLTIYYNMIFIIGVVFRLPSKVLYVAYKKSLSRFKELKNVESQ